MSFSSERPTNSRAVVKTVADPFDPSETLIADPVYVYVCVCVIDCQNRANEAQKFRELSDWWIAGDIKLPITRKKIFIERCAAMVPCQEPLLKVSIYQLQKYNW